MAEQKTDVFDWIVAFSIYFRTNYKGCVFTYILQHGNNNTSKK